MLQAKFGLVVSGIAACIAFSCFTPAYAQSSYVDSQGQEYSHRYYKKRADRIYLSLVRKQEFDSGQFILRMATGSLFSGCPKLGNLGYQVKFENSVMVVDIGEYTVDMRDLPSASHYACNVSGRTPAAEIPLTKQQLLDQGIKQVEFRNGPFIDKYNLELSDHYVRLKPSDNSIPAAMRHQPQKLSNVSDPLTHWFYPEGTVMLYTPGADPGSGAEEGLREVADHYGLVPLTEILPSFNSPLTAPGYSYYVDSGNQLPPSLFEEGGQRIGTTNIHKVVYGLRGDQQVVESLDVFAKPPGANE